jgi:hypothetical protein
VAWAGRLAAAALTVCAVTHFPLHHDGVSLRLHASTAGLSILSVAVALILVVRPGTQALALAAAIPAILAVAHAYGRSLPSGALPRAVDLALAPPWLAGAAAVTAALLALAALVVRVVPPFPGRRRAARPPAPEPRRTAE